MRSKPLDAIAAEARGLMASGAFELNLIGQDTTSYGMDVGYDGGLPGLLKTIDGVAREFGGGWMRLMYAYPSKFDDASIDAIARLDNIVKYIDMPLQHASDSMLSAMRRHTTSAHTRELLGKLRERVPGIAIRTTFIVGFPGETDDDFEELLEFVSEQQFEMLGVFRYSAEAGTPAGTMEKDPALAVPDEVKREREERLMLLQQEIAFENAKLQAESKVQLDVLIDSVASGKSKSRATTGVTKGGALYTGRAYFQAPSIDSLTYVQSTEKRSPGELVRCTVVDANGYDLIAVPTDELEKKISLPIAHRH
jgi:ribosomal protein S12 methylthiotransferase